MSQSREMMVAKLIEGVARPYVDQIQGLRNALVAIMQAHKFNVALLPPSEVHAIAAAAVNASSVLPNTPVEVVDQRLPIRLLPGDTYPSGDCGHFQAGIHVGDWFQRVSVYGNSPDDAEQLRDAILRTLTAPKGVLE